MITIEKVLVDEWKRVGWTVVESCLRSRDGGRERCGNWSARRWIFSIRALDNRKAICFYVTVLLRKPPA